MSRASAQRTNDVYWHCRKSYATLVSARNIAPPNATTEVIRDTTPLNKQDYPDITYWTKRLYLDEKNRREEFGKKKGKGKKKPGRKPKGDDENVRFWHFEE